MQGSVTDGETPVATGKIASIVTTLHMLQAPDLESPAAPHGIDLVDVADPEPDWYLDLFRRIGAGWLWFSRLALDAEALEAILHDPALDIAAPRRGDRDIGLLELDFRQPKCCEIAFFGFVPGETGRGLGRWMMAEALKRAWRPGIERVWVHTCTLDHPGALAFYRRNGFTPYARSVEVFDDPRLIGLLPRTAAPHIPIV